MTVQAVVSMNWEIARYVDLARELEQLIHIQVCYCAEPFEVAKQLTPSDAPIVIGGPAEWF